MLDKFFHEVFDHNFDGILVIDNNFKITHINTASEKITGFTEGEAIGKYCYEILKAKCCKNACPINLQKKGEKPETLRIEFDPSTGRCKAIFVNNKEFACDDKAIAIPLTETYFCTEPDDQHPANTRIYGKKEAYCGNVDFLTEGADIRYLANPAAGNRKCKIIGGSAICYPP